MPLLITQGVVGSVIWKMSRSAGPLGSNAEHLKDICMQHGVTSERHREAIATLT